MSWHYYMSIKNIKPVNFFDYNNSEKERPANLKYNGSLNSVNGLYVKKFTITKRMPVYIPRLVALDENVPIPNFMQMSVPTNYSNNPYRTNLSVIVKGLGGVIDFYYSMVNVRYETKNLNSLIPMPFNLFNDDLARNMTLNNEYFYVYSTTQLLELIVKAFVVCANSMGNTINDNEIIMRKNANGKYEINILQSKQQTLEFYINNELFSMFPFEYEESLFSPNYKKIVFKQYNTNMILGNAYSCNVCEYSSSRIYPFRSLVVTSNSLNVEKILQNSVTMSQYNNQIVEMYKFDLNIINPDESNDCMYLTPPAFNEILSLNGMSDYTNFGVDIYMQTEDRYNVELKLKPREFCTLSLVTTKL